MHISFLIKVSNFQIKKFESQMTDFAAFTGASWLVPTSVQNSHFQNEYHAERHITRG